jgi:hypothetical protein
MTIHTLAADICDRIPEMARDSKTNNQKVIETMIREFLDATRCSPPANVPESELPTVEEIQAIYESR